jgi:hypothetical protein
MSDGHTTARRFSSAVYVMGEMLVNGTNAHTGDHGNDVGGSGFGPPRLRILTAVSRIASII